MILPMIALIRFQFTHQQFQERRFSDTVGAYDSNATGKIDAKIGFDEQWFVSGEIEANVWKWKLKRCVTQKRIFSGRHQKLTVNAQYWWL